jgi:2-amino-4-hydroxy-6-hydroxymethyldihydropteridine diphosphokinase/dihydropteroate synthase
MGDRVDMIEQACNEMDATGKMRIVRTSNLFESKAMYVEDQDKFLNGVCKVCCIFRSRQAGVKSSR